MSQQSWRLPPLNSLRVFASAGRHQNFTSAAKELYVTVGAVSRQIKLLEEHVGVSLFVRTNHDIALTPAGRSYHTAICNILNRIEAGTNRLVGSAQSKPLHILCPMTLALTWLTPRLKSFHYRFPDQQIRLTTTLSPLHNLPNVNDVDIAFQLSSGPVPGWVSMPVLQSRLTLVCSPSLIAPRRQLDSINELANYTLLKSTVQLLSNPTAWDLLAAEATDLDLHRIPSIDYPSSGLALQAAIEGKGIAVGEAAFVENDLREGRLIKLFNKELPSGRAYYLVHGSDAWRDYRVKRFKNWLQEQVEGNA